MVWSLPIEFIRLILVMVFTASTILGVRIYVFDPEKRLNRVTAIGLFVASAFAIVEYEITHIRELDYISFFSVFHSSLAVLLVFFSAWSARLFGNDKKRLPKWAWDSLLILLGGWAAFLLYNLLLTPFNPDYGHYMSELGMWKYFVSWKGFRAWAFHGFMVYATLFMSASYFIAYINSDKPHEKRWRLFLFITYTILPVLLLYFFLIRVGSSAQGDYFVSPFFGACIFVLAWIYSNFKLFEISPATALHEILDSMSNLVLITDDDFVVKFSNKALTDNFAIESGRLRNKKLEKLLYLIQMKNWQESLEAVQRLEKGSRYEREFSILWEGESRYFLAIVSPVFNANYYKTGYVIVATDLSNAKKAEFQLRNYATQLEQSNKELENFAYIASHDLKSPVRNINSFVNLLERKLRPITDSDMKDYFHFIKSNTHYMYNLIQDILDYSRVKDKIARVQEIDLNHVIKGILRSNQDLIESKNVTVQYNNLPQIQSNPSLMMQLFQNLIVNGIKYNQNQTPIIIIQCDQKDDWYVFSVKDNGIGIAEAYHEHVFGMFKRLDTKDYYEGTGIGLAICKRIVELHNGEIWLDSKLEEGSNFYFTLGQ